MNPLVSPQVDNGCLTPEEVEAYLLANPTFFQDHLPLLEVMMVPHPSGEAVSLVARQLDLLREKNHRLLKQLDELVQIARDNDVLYQRIHQLTLTLLEAKSVEDVLASLDWGMHQYFQTDFAVIRILEPRRDSAISNLFVVADSPDVAWCEVIIEGDKPLCGKPDAGHVDFLFGEDAGVVQSYAVIALRHAGLRGIFAIGSRDEQRFHSDMGSVFLRQMSEVLAAKLSALINDAP
jgi:uncharacterized protein YigA (DUF484 family)